MDLVQTPLEKYVITLEEEQQRLVQYIQTIEKNLNDKLVIIEQDREIELMILELLIMKNNLPIIYNYATIKRLDENKIKVFKRFGYVYLLYDVINERHIIAFHDQHRQDLLNLEPKAIIALRYNPLYHDYDGLFEFVLC